MHHPTDRITHTTAFVTPVVQHWLEREIAQWVYPMKDRSDDPSHHERTLLPRSYISLPHTAGCTAPRRMWLTRTMLSCFPAWWRNTPRHWDRPGSWSRPHCTSTGGSPGSSSAREGTLWDSAWQVVGHRHLNKTKEYFIYFVIHRHVNKTKEYFIYFVIHRHVNKTKEYFIYVVVHRHLNKTKQYFI